jgi:PIN domain nuclease of toxin-antitoxin system
MRYLIDTNIFIRIIEDYDVSGHTKSILEDFENMIYVSSESVKEYIHLSQTGKISEKNKKLSLDIADLIENRLGFNIKFVAKEHLQRLATLERVDGHNDPSDRLIISQSIAEKIPLISSDTKFPKYRKQGLELITNR